VDPCARVLAPALRLVGIGPKFLANAEAAAVSGGCEGRREGNAVVIKDGESSSGSGGTIVSPVVEIPLGEGDIVFSPASGALRIPLFFVVGDIGSCALEIAGALGVNGGRGIGRVERIGSGVCDSGFAD